MVHTNQRLSAAFNELASTYEQTVDRELRKFWGIDYPGFVSHVLDMAVLRESDTVLDIATGTCLIPRTIANNIGDGGGCPRYIVGIDLTFQVLGFGKEKIDASRRLPSIYLTCASALALPFAPAVFDCVFCALAAHHIRQDQLLEQVARVLKPGGQFILSDVVASPYWRLPGIKPLLRLSAFIYFFLKNTPARAWAESSAVSNVHTVDQWRRTLLGCGFSDIVFHQPSIHPRWSPSAVLITATAEPVK